MLTLSFYGTFDNMHVSFRASLGVGVRRIAFMAPLVGLTFPALAHNAPVHRAMTDLAYEIIVIASADADLGPGLRLIGNRPESATEDKWETFLRDMKEARARIRALETGLGPAKQPVCSPQDIPDINWASRKPLRDMLLPVSLDFSTCDGCGVDFEWLRDSPNRGLYSEYNRSSPGSFDPPEPPHGTDYSGEILGFWAADIDDHNDDTHLFPNITNLVGGLGALKTKVEELTSMGYSIPLIPIFCIVEWLFGDGGNCADDAKDFADNTNPARAPDVAISDLPECIVWRCDIAGRDYVGLWHFVGLHGTAHTTFDDPPGYQMDSGGPNGMADEFVIGMIWLVDHVGLSLDPDRSRGVQYQISGGNDFHRDTLRRERAEWRQPTIAHLIFEPVDNLAKYGWTNFLPSEGNPSRSAEPLSYPLHAIGDVTVPMHVVGTSGWGHRPFEDAVENAWPRLIYLSDASNEADAARALQVQQATRILAKAYSWRQFILDWRVNHPDHQHDLPVRDLVTALAQETFDYANAQELLSGVPFTLNAWPYKPIVSLAYLKDKVGTRLEYSGDADVDRTRPLIENGVAATLAFLVSAMEH
jgi:hypothetical protein